MGGSSLAAQTGRCQSQDNGTLCLSAAHLQGPDAGVPAAPHEDASGPGSALLCTGQPWASPLLGLLAHPFYFMKWGVSPF